MSVQGFFRLAGPMGLAALVCGAGVAMADTFFYRSSEHSFVEPSGETVLEFGQVTDALLSSVAVSRLVTLPDGDDRTVVPIEPAVVQICPAGTCPDGSAVRAGPVSVSAGVPFRLLVPTGEEVGRIFDVGADVGGEVHPFRVTVRDVEAFVASPGRISDVPPGDVALSEASYMEGYGSAAVRVSDGAEFRICSNVDCSDSGPWRSDPLAASDGSYVQMRVPALRELGAVRTVALTWGRAETQWEIETRRPAAPDAFVVASRSGVVPGQRVVSDPVHLAGMVGAGPFSARPPAGVDLLVSVDDGPFGRAPVSIRENASFRLSVAIDGDADGRSLDIPVLVAGTASTWVVRLADEHPDEFSVPVSAFAAPGARVLSEAIEPSGFDVPVTLTLEAREGVSAPLVQLRSGGLWGPSRDGSTVVRPGDAFRIEATARPEEGRDGLVRVSLGTVHADWTLRTGRSTPTAFRIPETSGAGGTSVHSSRIDLAELTVDAALFLPEGVEVSVDRQPPARLSSVPAGSSVRFSTVAPPGLDGERASHRIVLGGVSTDWDVVAHDVTPDAFSMESVSGEDHGSFVVSEAIVPTGYSHAAAIVLAGEGSPQVSVAGGQWSAGGSVSPGQSFRIRLQASSQPLQARVAEVAVGGFRTRWSVTSAGSDANPSSASMEMVGRDGLDPSGLIVSERITPVGFDMASVLTVSGEGDPQVSVQGRPWVSSARLRPGEGYQVRVRTGDDFGTERVVRVAVGTTSVRWLVVTRPEDSLPDAFAFGDLSGQPGRSVVVSQSVIPVGYRDAASLTVDGGELSVNGGEWGVAGTIFPGQSVRVRLQTADPDGLEQRLVMFSEGVAISEWTVRTVDTMMDVPWTAAELASMFADPRMDTSRVSSTRTVSGFATPALFEGVSCRAERGTAGNLNGHLFVDGVGRYAGASVPVGSKMSMHVHGSTVGLDSEGTCDFRIGGRVIQVRWRTIEEAPNTTQPRGMEFVAAATPGAYAYMGPHVPFGNRSPTPVSIVAPADARAEIQVSGTSTWVAASADSPVRVPPRGSFTVRSVVPSSGAHRIRVNIGNRWQYYEVTPDAARVDMASQLPASIFPTSYRRTSYGNGIFLEAVTPNVSFNQCVDMSTTGGFYLYKGANGSGGQIDAPDIYKLRFCPGETILLMVIPPNEAGETIQGRLTIGNWSQALSYTVAGEGLDTDPAPFSFSDVSNADGDVRIVSGVVVPRDYNAPVRVHASGEGDPVLSVNGGAWTAGSVRIQPGQNLRVALTTGRADGSTRKATVRMGATQTVWSVTTSKMDADAFSFNETRDVAPGTIVSSDQIAVAGLGTGQANATVSGEGVTFSVNGGTQRTAAVVRNGDRIVLSARAPDGFERSMDVTLRVGSTSGTWIISTRAARSRPNAFVIPEVRDAAPDSIVESRVVTPEGNLDPADVTVSGPEAEISIDGGPWVAAGRILPGDGFVVRARADRSPAGTSDVEVVVGGEASSWTITTQE